MKSLKVLACAACLMGTVSGVGFAKDVQTIAGSMVLIYTNCKGQIKLVKKMHS